MPRVRLSREERKKSIRDVTVELITEKGFGNTSVQDIIDRTNISKGGFYHYYANKEELFKEILEDALQYRKTVLTDYRDKNKGMPRKELIVELLLDKILDYNRYKKMFVKLITEMSNDIKIMQLYNSLDNDLTEDFMDFFKKEGFDEFIKISNEEFGVIIISLIMVTTMFGYHDNEKLRDMLRDMFTAYFERIGLFGDEK